MTLNELTQRLIDIKAEALKHNNIDMGELQVIVKYKVSPRRHEYRVIQFGDAGRLCFQDSTQGFLSREANPKTDYVVIEASREILHKGY